MGKEGGGRGLRVLFFAWVANCNGGGGTVGSIRGVGGVSELV